MSNEKGICNDCQHKETCSLHKKNPWLKVTDCGLFLMTDTLKKISNELFNVGEQK